MDELPASSPSPGSEISSLQFERATLLHFIALKYALAGDLPSVEPLEQLGARLQVIDWKDPAFIQFSDEMRAPLPRLTAEQEHEYRPALMALLHLYMERVAQNREAVNSLIPQARELIAQQEIQKASTEKMIEMHEKLFAIANALLEANSRMRDKLEMLGVAVGEYNLSPELFQ